MHSAFRPCTDGKCRIKECGGLLTAGCLLKPSARVEPVDIMLVRSPFGGPASGGWWIQRNPVPNSYSETHDQASRGAVIDWHLPERHTVPSRPPTSGEPKALGLLVV